MFLVIESRRPKSKDDIAVDAGEGLAANSLFPEGRQPKASTMRAEGRFTQAQLIQLEFDKERETIRGYQRLSELWEDMLKGSSEEKRLWMVEAGKMVDSFRETRHLFSTKRVSSCFSPAYNALETIISRHCLRAQNTRRAKKMKNICHPDYNWSSV